MFGPSGIVRSACCASVSKESRLTKDGFLTLAHRNGKHLIAEPAHSAGPQKVLRQVNAIRLVAVSATHNSECALLMAGVRTASSW